MVTAIGLDGVNRVSMWITLSDSDYDFLSDYISRNNLRTTGGKLLSVRAGCEMIVKNFVLQELGVSFDGVPVSGSVVGGDV
jgi:hypothetical protein